MQKLLTIIGLLLITAGCGKQPFEKFERVEGRVWKYSDPHLFKVAIKEPGEYRLYIQMRYTQEYNYSNIWVGLTKKDPEGKIEKARFNIPLYDVHGKPYGSFAGKFFDRSYPDAEVDGQKLSLNFDKTGTYDIIIQHNMRMDDLNGIEEVGLRIMKL
jgi:gliding motility-associated lipoprotein GldH